MKNTGHLRETFRLGAGAIRKNLLPACVLWAIALALVMAYYYHSGTREKLDIVGRLKEEWSPWVAMISTAVFGSLVPAVVQRIFTKGPGTPPRRVAGYFVFWAIIGLEVEYFYRFQNWMFGAELNFTTVAWKTFVDEFIWVPFLAIPQTIFGYLLIEKDGSIPECRAALKRRPYLRRAIPLMIANWVVWIPTVSLVYLFPLPLQLPLMNIVLGMWCLLVMFFSLDGDD